MCVTRGIVARLTLLGCATHLDSVSDYYLVPALARPTLVKRMVQAMCKIDIKTIAENLVNFSIVFLDVCTSLHQLSE